MDMDAVYPLPPKKERTTLSLMYCSYALVCLRVRAGVLWCGVVTSDFWFQFFTWVTSRDDLIHWFSESNEDVVTGDVVNGL